MERTFVRRSLGKLTSLFVHDRGQEPQAPAPVRAPAPAPAPSPADTALAPATGILGELHGYRRTLETKRPAAADGSPLPWYTYPAIEYFNAFNAQGLRIFEFGSGNSSLYWARKGAAVWCVEHDPAWHARMQEQAAPLQGLALRETRDAYAQAIHEPGGAFDMIVIDGVWRVDCVQQALSALQPNGFVLLDNSDWYTDVWGILRERGFFPIDFNGFGPCNPYCWTTTLFVPFQTPMAQRVAFPAPIGGIAVQKGETW